MSDCIVDCQLGLDTLRLSVHVQGESTITYFQGPSFPPYTPVVETFRRNKFTNGKSTCELKRAPFNGKVYQENGFPEIGTFWLVQTCCCYAGFRIIVNPAMDGQWVNEFVLGGVTPPQVAHSRVIEYTAGVETSRTNDFNSGIDANVVLDFSESDTLPCRSSDEIGVLAGRSDRRIGLRASTSFIDTYLALPLQSFDATITGGILDLPDYDIEREGVICISIVGGGGFTPAYVRIPFAFEGYSVTASANGGGSHTELHLPGGDREEYTWNGSCSMEYSLQGGSGEGAKEGASFSSLAEEGLGF